MTLYPNLVALLDTFTADELADLVDRSGVSGETIAAAVAGTHAASLSVQMRIGTVLDINPLELFRLDADLEATLPPRRYVSDPPTLRLVDGRRP